MSRVLVDSGIKWIGKYPDEWNLFPLRAVVENINEKNNPIKFTNVLSLTNKLGVVPYEEKAIKEILVRKMYLNIKLLIKIQ